MGGRSPGTVDASDGERKLLPGIGGRKSSTDRSDDDIEPFCYLPVEYSVAKTVVDDFAITTILDISAGDGVFAEVALTSKARYIGLCVSDVHMELLRKRLLCMDRIRQSSLCTPWDPYTFCLG